MPTKRGVTEFLRILTSDESTIVDLETDLCIVLDDGGNILRVNQAFERLLGRDEATVIRHGLIDFIHPDDLAAFLHSFDPARNIPSFRMLKFGHGELLVKLMPFKFRRVDGEQRGYIILRPLE